MKRLRSSSKRDKYALRKRREVDIPSDLMGQLFSLCGREQVSITECPFRFRTAISNAFHGLGIAKKWTAQNVAASVNEAIRQLTKPILNLVAIGIQAVKARWNGETLFFELKLFNHDPLTVLGPPSCFVSRG